MHLPLTLSRGSIPNGVSLRSASLLSRMRIIIIQARMRSIRKRNEAASPSILRYPDTQSSHPYFDPCFGMSPDPLGAVAPFDDPRRLTDLAVGARARVARVLDDDSISRRLLEVGFIAGASIEIVASMWPAADPLAVRVGGSTFALRRHEADRVVIV
jgi:ferrous iron transport protein A